MSHDDDWLTQLLSHWMILAPEVRAELHQYLQLPPGDRKNQRRLEKKLKRLTAHVVPVRLDIIPRNAHV